MASEEEWSNEETIAFNKKFVGKWHRECDENNEQIYFAISIDQDGKIKAYMIGINKPSLVIQLRSIADAIEDAEEDRDSTKYDINLN